MLAAWRLLLPLFGAVLLAQDSGPEFDLVLRGGTIVDGAARTLTPGDLAIRDGRIAAIGTFTHASGTPVLRVDGLHIAPGFIDLHGHADGIVVREPMFPNFLRMGVTTLITGNCGGSVANLETHLGRLDNGGIGLNYGSLIGHGTIRRAVLGSARRAPDAAELRSMTTLVDRAMQAGAFGLSTGLIYVPGSYAELDELSALATVAGQHGGLYVTHMRNENDTMPAAIAEAVTIGERSGCRVHISHIKCSGRKNHGRAGEMLALLQQHRKRGLQVSADQYAYDASSTSIDVLFPTDELAEGRAQFALRLGNDAAFRARIKQALLTKMDDVGYGDFRYARIASAKNNEALHGLLLPEAGKRRLGDDSREAQAELAMLLFTEAAPNRVTMVYHTMADADVDAYMAQDWIAIASDAGIRTTAGTARPHPRGAGNNARVLARYVRERKVLDLPTAVHKMTSLPASLFGIRDRGQLRIGAFADLVVFDAATVTDCATYADPLAPPTGIAYVLVNGRIAVSHGQLTGVRAGQVLRHVTEGGK